MEEIIKRISDTMEDSNKTIADAAKYIGVHERQLYRWKIQNGTEMGIFKLTKFCEFYGVSADYILGLPEGLTRPR